MKQVIPVVPDHPQAAAGADHPVNPDLDVARTAWEFLSRFRLPAQ